MGLVVRNPILAIVSIFFAAAVLTVAVAVALTAGITGVGGTTQAPGRPARSGQLELVRQL